MIDMKIIDLRNSGENPLFRRLLSRTQLEIQEVNQAVESILKDVKENGDAALLKYVEQFTKASLEPSDLKVIREEIEEAYKSVDPELIETIRRAAANIRSFHEKQKEQSWFSTGENGIMLGQIYRPVETAGVYVPGGKAAYPSSVLMNVIPAKVAGVNKIVMMNPPGPDGKINPGILVAANEAGADEIYKGGGAEAIAAMAFGTKTIPRVDKIVGPGSIYVATAKRMVFGYCGIDSVAGPSEIMVIADETADPKYVAADLLSQAEHDEMASSVLVTTSAALAEKVRNEIIRQAEGLERKEIMKASLENYGGLVIVNTLEEAVELVNRIAPEHLEVCTSEPFALLDSIRNAGAIFLGSYASEPLGDYFAGPNHILPTGGTARFFSPLTVGDFIKKSSVIYYTKKALDGVQEDVIRFAEAEGLFAHANAIKVRCE